MRERLRPALIALVASAGLAALLAPGVAAQNGPPGPPDVTFVFGQVLQNGENIVPEQQPIIVFVNGRACGWDETKVAEAHPDNPPDDIGKTVYAVDVRADGSGPFQAPGCGTNGDEMTFYLPAIGRSSSLTETWGGSSTIAQKRLDLAMDRVLGNRLPVPLTATDGTN